MTKFKIGDCVYFPSYPKDIYYIYYIKEQYIFFLGEPRLGNTYWGSALIDKLPSFEEAFDKSGFPKMFKHQFYPYWGSFSGAELYLSCQL